LKISFYQPQYNQIIKFKKQYWLPYTVGCLWSYASNKRPHWQLGDVVFQRESIEKYVSTMAFCDIACFSTYVWNYRYNLELAKQIKIKFPKIHICFGGPHINQSTYEEFEFIDSVVINEGEESLIQVMDDIEQGNQSKGIYSSPRIESLENMPSPYLTGFFDNMISNNPDVYWNATLETNRGCPYKCTFCEWGGLTGSKIKNFDVSKVTRELQWIANNPIVTIFLSDANFGIFKDRDLAIAKEAKKILKGSKIEYISLNYPKNSNNVVFEIANEFGDINKGITFSTQSMNEATLEAIKRKNMKINNLSEMFKLAEKNNLEFYTDLILGLPEETLETWKNGVCKLLDLGNHNKMLVQPGYLLPNTEWNVVQKEKYKVETVTIIDFMTATEEDSEIKERADMVVATKDMNVYESVDAWMYSWMIDNLHLLGYTKIIARYCRSKFGNGWEFYRNFYDFILQNRKKYKKFNQEYERVYSAALELFLTGKTQDRIYNVNNLMYSSRNKFYDIMDELFDLGEDAARSFGNISENIMEVQKRFIYNEKYTVPYNVSIDIDLDTWLTCDNKGYKIIEIEDKNFNTEAAKTHMRGKIRNNLILPA